MITYILKNITIALINITILIFLSFVLMNLLPSDPVKIRLGVRYNQKDAEIIKQKFNLDKPLITQFFTYLKNILNGNFGISILTGEDITLALSKRLPRTLKLISISFTLSLPAIILGILLADKKIKKLETIIEKSLLALSSIPLFASASISIFLATFIFKTSLLSSISEPKLSDYILPALILSLTPSFILLKTFKDSLKNTLNQPFIIAHKAFGFNNKIIILKFALKNCSTPIITITSNLTAYYLASVYVVEYAFGIGGIGTMAVSSALNYDIPVVISVALITALIFNLVNILTKIIIPLFDKRIIHEKI